MTDRCPYLEYRRASDEQSFDHDRAFCPVVERFVQPMRADVCNARYDLAPSRHCEFYRDAKDLGPLERLAGDSTGAPERDG